MIEGPLLLCTDLDRTLLPNGEAPESPRARALFARLCAQPAVTVAYVSGRDPGRVAAAVAEYGLPAPDVVIADVGTTIAGVDGARWEDWDALLAADWRGRTAGDLAVIVGEVAGMTLQEPSRQARFKLSYEVRPVGGLARVTDVVERRLAEAGVAAAVVESVDEVAGVGLIDVLPAAAGKLAAIEHVARRLGRGAGEIVFAGDSGNDLDVLVSSIPAVLVANATAEVRERAALEARKRGVSETLYLARGGALGMNGNYAAGILEGVLHFRPDCAQLLEEAV